MKRQEWIRIVVAVLVTVAVVIGVVNWVAPGKVPPVIRSLVQRSDKLCVLLEGDDREACTSLAAVASALARPKPAPSAMVGTGGSGGATP